MSDREGGGEGRGASDEGADERNDPIVEQFLRFTPDPAGLDRDALLFAAGRASARPSRRWQALAGALAACQLLNLAVLWPRPSPPTPSATTELAAVDTPPAAVADSPYELGIMRARMISDGGTFRVPATNEPLVPDESPLRVFPLPKSRLLN
ncbi:MAG TPA: hypothetical protein VGY55_16850 [Pirellulales bacterium]|nr:hypothetical protein [Pirellulales bacterium]